MKRQVAVGFITLGSLYFLAGCSTASVRVLPGENGVNHVVVDDIGKESAQEEAVKAANKYCEHKNKEAVFSEDKTQYTGKMDEETRDTIRKASTAAVLLGGVGTVASRETLNPGAILGSAGTVGYVMTDGRDYQSKVTFKCQ